jgi:hypothetical protein
MMSGYFLVDPEQVTATSQSITGQQGTPIDLAGTLRGAGMVDTGDPTLDAEIESLVGHLASKLSRLAEVLGEDARGLGQVSENYQTADTQIAADFASMNADIPNVPRLLTGGANPPAPAPSPPNPGSPVPMS